MDCQHWLVDLELPTAFWVDLMHVENKKQDVQVGLCCFLGTRWKVQTYYRSTCRLSQNKNNKFTVLVSYMHSTMADYQIDPVYGILCSIHVSA